MTVLLSLVAAVLYGISDFAGGIGARRVTALSLLVWSTPVGAVLMLVLVFAFPGHLTGRAALFGVFAGLAGLTGVVVMYHLMTIAPINVVSPVTAVLAGIVPVAVGVETGEQPGAAASVGILVGLGAIFLVSRSEGTHEQARVGPRTLALALLSGLGFGLYFVFLARAGGGTGLWPLAISRFTSSSLVLAFALPRGAGTLLRRRDFATAVVAGAGDTLANMFFLLATHDGLLSLASVLTSLYPATTVLLAVTVLKERLTWTQRGGLVLAGAAVVLITV